jgi:hypothetical protein
LPAHIIAEALGELARHLPVVRKMNSHSRSLLIGLCEVERAAPSVFRCFAGLL